MKRVKVGPTLAPASTVRLSGSCRNCWRVLSTALTSRTNTRLSAAITAVKPGLWWSDYRPGSSQPQSGFRISNPLLHSTLYIVHLKNIYLFFYKTPCTNFKTYALSFGTGKNARDNSALSNSRTSSIKKQTINWDSLTSLIYTKLINGESLFHIYLIFLDNACFKLDNACVKL